MATVTKPLALNESLNTTEQTPRNVADVLSDGLENIKQAIEGSGAGGHSIIDSEGNTMPQETAMQFADSFVSDDDVNGKTIVENIKEVSPADYASTTDEGIIVTDDGNDALIGAVSDDYVEVEADGVKTYGQLFNEIRNSSKFDATKINDKSYIFDGQHYYRFTTIVYWQDVYGGYAFSMPVGNATYTDIETIILHDTNSTLVRGENGTITDLSSYAPPQYQVFRLYYGNKKAVVDLQTTANRCLYDSNTTVKQKIDSVHSWTKLGEKSNGESVTVDLSNYSEILIATRVGSQPYSSFIIPVGVLISESSEHKFYGSLYQDTTYNAVFRIQYSSGSLYFYQESLNGWQSLRGIIYVK